MVSRTEKQPPPTQAPTAALRVRTRFQSPELNNLSLPIQIRKDDLSLVAHTRSGETVSGLEYGQKYLVLAQLPAGYTLSSEVTISRRSKSPVEVTLEPRGWQQSPHEVDEVQHFLGNPAASILPQSSSNQLPPERGLPPTPYDAPGSGVTGIATGATAPSLEVLGSQDAPEDGLDELLSDYLEVPREGPQGEGRDFGPGLEALGPEPSGRSHTHTEPPLNFEPPSYLIQGASGLPQTEIEIRLFKGNALACSAAPQSIGQIQSRQVSSTVYKLSIPGGEGLWFLQAKQPGRPATNVALPISPGLGCEVVLSRLYSGSPTSNEDGISLEVHMANVDANAMARYRGFGFIGDASTEVENLALDADHLLNGDVQDPIAAVVESYARLRFNRLKHIDRWSEKLYQSFAWLPDGAAIRGEYLARVGRHPEALEAFLNVANQGLPLFIEGISFTMERLDLYLRAPSTKLTPYETDRARSVLPLLHRYVGVADLSKMLLRFSGSSPNLPGLETSPITYSAEKDSTVLRLTFQAEESPSSLGFSTTMPASARVDEQVVTPSGPETTSSSPREWEDSGGGLELLGPTAAPQVHTPSGALVMELSENVIAATEMRYRERETHRTGIQNKIRAISASGGSLLEVDDSQRVALRTHHVLRHPLVSKALDSITDGKPLESLGTVEANHLLERILGGNNLLDAAFLELGSAVAKSVARIQIRDQFRTIGFGTGFMISPRLILTNNHVLPDARTARLSRAEFNFQNGIDGRPHAISAFNLEPDTFFVTDVDLDFTVVAIQSSTDDAEAELSLARFGYNRVTADQGKLLLGEPINIIQHPDGQPKQIALQQNELIDRLDHFIHYHTDTSPGSSGSPLYNNQWEVIGLHHSGVPARDPSGNILTIDGTVWNPSLGESRIKWVANEGVRLSSIIEHLATVKLSPQQQALLVDVFNPPNEDSFVSAPMSSTTLPSTHSGGANSEQQSRDASTTTPLSPELPTSSQATATTTAGGLSFTIPIVVTVQFGEVALHRGRSSVSSTEQKHGRNV
jgi:V8-like Glu-specific endopeptidase